MMTTEFRDRGLSALPMISYEQDINTVNTGEFPDSTRSYRYKGIIGLLERMHRFFFFFSSTLQYIHLVTKQLQSAKHPCLIPALLQLKHFDH